MKLTFQKLKDAIIYITPNFSDEETIRYKFRLTKLILIAIGYTVFIMAITSLILGLTPLKNLVFHFEHEDLKIQAEKTIELERKINYLTRELQSISSTNKKLEYAFLLGTTDSLDTNSAAYDSLKYEASENRPYGGNLYFIFNKFLSSLSQKNQQISNYFLKPSDGLIIHEFNPDNGHLGIDFAVKPGSAIFSTQGGLVLFSDFTIDDGHKIIIQHPKGYISIYKHCSALLKKERDRVVQGELIALSGNSGKNTTGPHLHFEIWKDGKPQNPKELITK